MTQPYVRSETEQRRWGLEQVHTQNLPGSLGHEGRTTSEDFIQNTSQRVDIGLGVNAGAIMVPTRASLTRKLLHDHFRARQSRSQRLGREYISGAACCDTLPTGFASPGRRVHSMRLILLIYGTASVDSQACLSIDLTQQAPSCDSNSRQSFCRSYFHCSAAAVG